MAKLHTPRADCIVALGEVSVELLCVLCGEIKRYSLPADLDLILQRGQDFSNYHRWCGEKSVARAPQEE